MIIKLFTLDGIRRKADRTISLNIGTALEQTADEMKELDLLHQQHILIAIKEQENAFKDAELDDLNIDVDLYDKNKSPSKRLRNTLWRLQESQLGQKPTDVQFSEFYRIKMNQMIEHFKEKLE